MLDQQRKASGLSNRNRSNVPRSNKSGSQLLQQLKDESIRMSQADMESDQDDSASVPNNYAISIND